MATTRSPLADPFSLPPSSGAARAGVIVVHGFAGSPFEMRPLGEHLAGAGYHVEGPRLAGHGGDSRALQGTAWPDWVDSVESVVVKMLDQHRDVFVCGQSLGGLITLELARRQPRLAAIVSLAAPMWLTPVSQGAVRLLNRSPLLRRVIVPRVAGSDCADPIMQRKNGEAIGPLGLPISAVGSLLTFMDHLRPRLGEIKAPTLLMHARLDHVAPYACMGAIASGLREAPTTTISLERSYHLISIDVERDQVFDAVTKHFDRHITRGGLPS
jgi:carboxylesterase